MNQVLNIWWRIRTDLIEEKKSQAGFLYTDDVCLMASNEQDLQMIFSNISGCISEYYMKVSVKSQWFLFLFQYSAGPFYRIMRNGCTLIVKKIIFKYSQ